MRRPGRLHAPEVEAVVAPGPDGMIELRAPGPGVFVPSLAQGELVAPGTTLGELVVLGRAIAVVAPPLASPGIAVRLPTVASHPVGYGALLVALDPSLSLGAGAPGAAITAAETTIGGLVFRAPTSGRFYGRPAPDKLPFVADGGELAQGATICLLEVMKTFHRVTYGGPGLPETARVRKVLVTDGDDVNAGDPLLALE